MAETAVQIDLSPIENALKGLDKRLAKLDEIQDGINRQMREANKAAGQSEVKGVSLAIYGALVLGLWTTVKDHDSVKTAVEGLKSALETLGGSVAPVFAGVINMVTSVIEAFNALPEPAKQIILVGALIFGALFGLLGVISQLVVSWGAIAGAFGGFAVIALKVIAVVGLIVLAIAALVAGVIYAYQNFEWFRNMVNAVWEGIKTGAMALWGAIQDGLSALWAFLQPIIETITNFFVSQWKKVTDWWTMIWPVLKEAFMNIWTAIMAFIGPIIQEIVALFQFAWPMILTLVTTVMEMIKAVLVAAWEIIKTIFITAWEIIKTVVDSAIKAIMSIVNMFAYLFTGQWDKLWQSALDLLASFGNLIVGTVGALIEGILSILSSLVGLAGSLISKAWHGVLTITGQLLGGLVDLVFGKVTEIGDTLRNIASQAADWGANLINEFIAGIRSKISGVIDTVKGIVSDIKNFLGFSSPTKKGPGRTADRWGPNFMEMFAAGIEEGIPALKNVARLSMGTLAMMGNPRVDWLRLELQRRRDRRFGSIRCMCAMTRISV